MYIGVDIGGTKCAVVLADTDGRILRKQRFETTTLDSTIGAIIKNVKMMGDRKSVV